MDTPICVFDAQTFVDHVHEIKSWIYGGHLRLVVPTCTPENVEQLYKKSVEPKPTAPEPSRSKTVAKPARKAHPAFDINPTIAREFFARIRKGKDEEHNVQERSLYYEDERWEAIHFQISEEEYTPWRDMPVEEPEAEVSDDRPLSWAELARKKLQANGDAEKAQGLKGSAKPKLVPKASGNEMSPWKMQNNAPKISAKEVPGHLRPLMSCVLWHLHESINRNDSNQLFLLSDQEEVRTVAKKLNITVSSSKKLREKIAASIEKVDLNATGMLEEENLAKPKERAKLFVSKDSTTEDHSEDLVPKTSANGELRPCGDHVEQNHSADGKDDIAHPKSSDSQTDVIFECRDSEEPAVASHDKTLSSNPSVNGTEVGLDPQVLVRGILDPSLLQAQIQDATGENRAECTLTQPRNLQPAAEIMQATSDQTRGREGAQPKPSADLKNLPAKAAPTIAQESFEDSDEEVVVFVPNPKRMSAQKKANVSSSRPTTAHGQSPAPPTQDSPKTGTSKVHSGPDAARHGSPNANPFPHGHPRSLSSASSFADSGQGSGTLNTVSHRHPRPLSSGPTVIDPDAFGRGFATNAGPGTLANVGTSRRSRQHSPRTSVQGLNPSANGTAAQNSPHASPSRHKAGRSPRPSSRAIPQTTEDSPPTSIPVISHQAYTRAPLVAPNSQSTQKSRFGPIGPPSKSAANLYPSSPVGGVDFTWDTNPRQAPVQRPRSANSPSVSSALNSTHHQPTHPNPLHDPAPSARGHQTQKYSKKSLFEPELDHTKAQPNTDFEPRRTNMPEVQYTLKSGTTREAARGKGKLWVG